MVVDLRQVAELSGVSISTASRALSGADRVSATTRAQVERAARELGYRPNATARSLRTQRSGLVGLLMPNLMNATFVTIAEAMQRQFEEHGFQLVLSTTSSDEQRERRSLEVMRDHRVDGAILAGSYPSAVAVLRVSGIPTVHLGRAPAVPAGHCVTSADADGARDAVRHLLQLGHQRIGIIAGPPGPPYDDERLVGYRDGLSRAGLPHDESLVWRGPYRPETGREGVACLLSLPRPPSALLVANHEAILGALPELQERHVRIPADLSVVCHEDSPMLRWWRPAMTVVDHDPQQIAQLGAELLLEQMRKGGEPAAEPRRFPVGARLISRDSCGPAQNASRFSRKVGRE